VAYATVPQDAGPDSRACGRGRPAEELGAAPLSSSIIPRPGRRARVKAVSISSACGLRYPSRPGCAALALRRRAKAFVDKKAARPR